MGIYLLLIILTVQKQTNIPLAIRRKTFLSLVTLEVVNMVAPDGTGDAAAAAEAAQVILLSVC